MDHVTHMDQTLFKRREVLLIERQIGEDIGQRAIAHFCQQPTDHQRDHHAARCNRGHQLRPSERGTKYSDSQTGASDEERAEVACDNLAERDLSVHQNQCRHVGGGYQVEGEERQRGKVLAEDNFSVFHWGRVEQVDRSSLSLYSSPVKDGEIVFGKYLSS